jgi:hypothetical protein
MMQSTATRIRATLTNFFMTSPPVVERLDFSKELKGFGTVLTVTLGHYHILKVSPKFTVEQTKDAVVESTTVAKNLVKFVEDDGLSVKAVSL